MFSEFCAQAGINYKELIDRFGNSDIAKRFIKKFPSDESFCSLKNALSDGDVKAAFIAAHTLKGLCLNLCFTDLAAASSAVTESLRSENIDQAKLQFPEVERLYEILIQHINTLD